MQCHTAAPEPTSAWRRIRKHIVPRGSTGAHLNRETDTEVHSDMSTPEPTQERGCV
jgi:hypothetical protein